MERSFDTGVLQANSIPIYILPLHPSNSFASRACKPEKKLRGCGCRAGLLAKRTRGYKENDTALQKEHYCCSVSSSEGAYFPRELRSSSTPVVILDYSSMVPPTGAVHLESRCSFSLPALSPTKLKQYSSNSPMSTPQSLPCLQCWSLLENRMRWTKAKFGFEQKWFCLGIKKKKLKKTLNSIQSFHLWSSVVALSWFGTVLLPLSLMGQYSEQRVLRTNIVGHSARWTGSAGNLKNNEVHAFECEGH